MPKPKLITIVGPTASGKSALAVELTLEFNGEIISADSRQVYEELNIGAGKITPAEMKGVPHHLLDVATLDQVFTVSDFKQLADQAIQDVTNRGKLPFLVGGTGFYIQAVIDNLELPAVPPDLKLRAELEQEPTEALVATLENLDPDRLQTIDTHNRVRLIRAIEIATTLGKIPVLNPSDSPFNNLILGLDIASATLTQNIKLRLLDRLDNGLIEEVAELKAKGVASSRLHALGLEYRFINDYLEEKLGKDEMISKLELAINQYAKRQLTWFKRDNRIKWIKGVEEGRREVGGFLGYLDDFGL